MGEVERLDMEILIVIEIYLRILMTAYIRGQAT